MLQWASMLHNDKLREADIVTSVILAGLGVAVIIGAFRMPMGGTYAGMSIAWYTSPGFFPLALGTMLVLCASGVFVRGWRDGAHRRLQRRLGPILASLPRSRAAWRIVTIWVLLVGYVLGLALHPFAFLARLLEPISGSPLTVFLMQPEGANYVFSSFVFLALFMYIFHYRPRPRRTWTTLSLMVAMCFLVAWGVGYVFTQHLYSPLPW